jgi:hypothetical protein
MKNYCWLSYLTSPGEMLPIGAQFANVAADGLELDRCYYDSLPTSSFSFLEMFLMQTMNEVKINVSFILVLKNNATSWPVPQIPPAPRSSCSCPGSTGSQTDKAQKRTHGPFEAALPAHVP